MPRITHANKTDSTTPTGATTQAQAQDYNQYKDKCNNPGLNEALTTAKKFDDEYYPPPQTISANEEWTIDATNAGNGNGFAEIIIAAGTPTLTLTGFTIRKRLVSTDTGQTVTLVDGHEYTIISIKRGSLYDLYVSDNDGSGSTPGQLLAPTITLLDGGSIQIPITIINPNSSNEDSNLVQYKLQSSGTWIDGITIPTGQTSGIQTGLVASSDYDFQVIAKGLPSDSNPSATVQKSTGAILLEDDFAGTTIDTGKWTVTNPDPTIVSVTQNDKLIIQKILDDNSTGGNGVDSTDSFDMSGTLVVNMEINSPVWRSNEFQRRMQMLADADNYTAILYGGTESTNLKSTYIAKIDAVVAANQEVDFTFVNKRIKIVIDNGTVEWFEYNSGWDSFAPQAAGTYVGSAPLSFFINAYSSGQLLGTDVLEMLSCKITDFDYTTQTAI